MQAKDYAHALYDLSLAKGASTSVLVKNLSGVLRTRGHERLLPRIAAEFGRLQEQDAKTGGIIVRVADEKSRKSALQKARALADERGLDTKTIKIKEDTALIDGFSVEGPGFRYDESARGSLVHLYRKLIAS